MNVFYKFEIHVTSDRFLNPLTSKKTSVGPYKTNTHGEIGQIDST